MRERTRALRLPMIGVLSQVLSSSGNYALIIIAARIGSPTEFGRLAIAIAAYTVILASNRSLVAEPLTIRHQADVDQLRSRFALTAGLLTGAIIGITLIAGGLGVGIDDGGRPFLVLGACLPFLLWLDVQRFQWFAVGRPGRSAALDGAWLVLFLIGVAVQGDLTLSTVWIVWCGSGALVGATAMVIAHGPGSLRASFAWFRSHLDLGGRFLVETSSTVVMVNLAQIAFAAVADAGDLGAIKGATSLFGPVNIFFVGLYPIMVGRAQRSREEMVRLGRQVTIAMTATTLLLTAFLLALPSGIGTAVLGETWTSAHDIIWLVGIGIAASVASAGAVIGLRALAAARQSMRVRLTVAVPTLVAPVAVGAVFGAIGFAFGVLIVAAAATAMMWRAYARVLPAEEWAPNAPATV